MIFYVSNVYRCCCNHWNTKSFQSIAALIYLFTIMHFPNQQLLKPLSCRNLFLSKKDAHSKICLEACNYLIIWGSYLHENTTQYDAEKMTEQGWAQAALAGTFLFVLTKIPLQLPLDSKRSQGKMRSLSERSFFFLK